MDERLINGLYTDRYELTMALVYWREGRAEEPAVFDAFFRKIPFGGGFAVIEDGTRALSEEDFGKVKKKLSDKGVRFASAEELLG